MREASNVLFILSDEHTRAALGCYGHPLIRTPNLDALAANGTRFTSAYCNSPLCVPSRASLATGRYVHETRCWDNGHPYEGKHMSWAGRLTAAGHTTAAIGKLHYRDSRPETGFGEEILPMHVRYGIGDLFGLLRDDPPGYGKVPASLAKEAGPGKSNHTEYDNHIARAAIEWLRKRSENPTEKPWVLFVSFVSPHFPLIAPQRYFDLYPLDQIPWPKFYGPDERPTHPVLVALNKAWNYDDFFDEQQVRVARAAYYGLCTFLDDNVGAVLQALEDCSFADNTRVIYSSDHGEMLGNRGMWSTSAMYEESVGIPLIMAGPDVPEGAVVDTPVSLVDCYPTVVESAGGPTSDEDEALAGRSLLATARQADPERAIFSEYHAGGSITGSFMLRKGRWKFVYYVGFAPQLFDLEADPEEAFDLGESPDHADVRSECEAELRKIVDPEEVNRQAFADQRATIERHGGPAAIRRRGHPGEHTLERELVGQE